MLNELDTRYLTCLTVVDHSATWTQLGPSKLTLQARMHDLMNSINGPSMLTSRDRTSKFRAAVGADSALEKCDVGSGRQLAVSRSPMARPLGSFASLISLAISFGSSSAWRTNEATSTGSRGRAPVSICSANHAPCAVTHAGDRIQISQMKAPMGDRDPRIATRHCYGVNSAIATCAVLPPISPTPRSRRSRRSDSVVS